MSAARRILVLVRLGVCLAWGPAACGGGEAEEAEEPEEAEETGASNHATADVALPQQPRAAPGGGGRVFAGGSPPPTTVLENPFGGEAQAAEEGGRLFAAYNCDGCHGGGGVGMIGPSLADGRWRYGGSAGAIFETIRDGRPNGMPAFGGIAPEAVIWKLVSYLVSLQPAADRPTVSF